MRCLQSEAPSILADRPVSTPHSLLPPPSSPCRIPPDLRSCRLPGVFIIRPCLPYRHGNCVAAGLLCSPNITPVLRYYEPIHHRLVVSHFPGLAGYMAYPAPSISRWDEDGFSSCLACPCHRAVPNTPPERLIASVSCDDSCCLRPMDEGSASGPRSFEAIYGFTCVTAR